MTDADNPTPGARPGGRRAVVALGLAALAVATGAVWWSTSTRSDGEDVRVDAAGRRSSATNAPAAASPSTTGPPTSLPPPDTPTVTVPGTVEFRVAVSVDCDAATGGDDGIVGDCADPDDVAVSLAREPADLARRHPEIDAGAAADANGVPPQGDGTYRGLETGRYLLYPGGSTPCFAQATVAFDLAPDGTVTVVAHNDRPVVPTSFAPRNGRTLVRTTVPAGLAECIPEATSPPPAGGRELRLAVTMQPSCDPMQLEPCPSPILEDVKVVLRRAHGSVGAEHVQTRTPWEVSLPTGDYDMTISATPPGGRCPFSNKYLRIELAADGTAVINDFLVDGRPDPTFTPGPDGTTDITTTLVALDECPAGAAGP